jgi:hypothetical protein
MKNATAWPFFLVPFFSVGTLFAVIGVIHVRNTSPVAPSPIDFLYAVGCAFIDMGCASGVAGLVVLSLARRLNRIVALKSK